MHSTIKQKSAFSLIELLVVLALVGLISVVAVPSYQEYRFKGQLKGVINNIQTHISYYVSNNHELLSTCNTTSCPYGITKIDDSPLGVRITFDQNIFTNSFTGLTSPLCIAVNYTTTTTGIKKIQYTTNLPIAKHSMLASILQTNLASITFNNAVSTASGTLTTATTTPATNNTINLNDRNANGIGEICASIQTTSYINNLCNSCSAGGAFCQNNGVCVSGICKPIDNICGRGIGGTNCPAGKACMNYHCKNCSSGEVLSCRNGKCYCCPPANPYFCESGIFAGTCWPTSFCP